MKVRNGCLRLVNELLEHMKRMGLLLCVGKFHFKIQGSFSNVMKQCDMIVKPRIPNIEETEGLSPRWSGNS